MIHIGFTGTRHGMTLEQCMSLGELCDSAWFWRQPVVIHHGDCIGADAEFHAMMRRFTGIAAIVLHQPTDSTHRAFCKFDESRAPLPYLKRNKAIVSESERMIATPAEMSEQPRGGTWATIRMTRNVNKPLVIVWPDGRVTEERWGR